MFWFLEMLFNDGQYLLHIVLQGFLIVRNGVRREEDWVGLFLYLGLIRRMIKS